MATLISPIPAIAFPHELAELEFEGAANEKFSLSLMFDGEVAYLSTLELSDTGDLAMNGVDTILRTFIDGKLSFLRVLVDGSEVANCHLLPCHVLLDKTAAVFTPRHFLTRNERQRTTEDGTIWISFYTSTQPEVINITALYWEGDRFSKKIVKAETAATAGLHAFRYEVGKLTKDLPGEAIAITAEAGERSMRFDITPMRLVFPVRFRNCFGCWETIIFPKWEEKYIPTYETAMISGRLRNVSREAHREIKCTLPELREEERASLEDLAGSSDIVELNQSRTLLQLSVDFRTDSSPMHSITGSITLREASASPSAAVKEPVRTFDDSFDKSFN